jgi:hypothetical protein
MRKQLATATYSSPDPRMLVIAMVGILSIVACTVGPSGGPSARTPTTSQQPTLGSPSVPGGPGGPSDSVQTTVPAEMPLDAELDPFKTSPPDECDPGRDTPGEPDYTRLAELPQRPVDLFPGVVNVAVEFTNAKEQPFEVVVSGANDDVVQQYIQEASVCLEAIPISASPIVAEPVYLDAILVTAASDITSQTASDLAGKRDELLTAGSSASLDLVVSEFGSNQGELLDKAISEAKDQLARAVAAGRMGQDVVDETPIEELLDKLIVQPAAPFLIDPARKPDSDAAWAALIGREPETVVVSFRSAERASGETDFDTVWFAADPTINSGQYRYYRAICSLWAGVAVVASAGSATAYMWRYDPYRELGSRYDAAGGSASSWLWASAADRTTWDVSVRGWSNGSYYSLYGGWTEGAGGTFCG